MVQEEIDEIAEVYHAYRNVAGKYEDVPGLCKVATLEEIKSNEYRLTSGIYVGTGASEEDSVPFEERISELRERLMDQFEESHRLQQRIVGYMEELL